MKKIKSTGIVSVFEEIKKGNTENTQYWLAHDLAKLLGYSSFRSLIPVIEKAKKACQKSNQIVENHFEETTEVIAVNDSQRRKIKTVKLSRYACYLVIMNADPDKEQVAKGQSYLAFHSRLAALSPEENDSSDMDLKKRLYLRRQMSKQNLRLATLAKRAGVLKPTDFAIFHNHGYMGLYGGLDAEGIREVKNIPKGENILNYMGNDELAANLTRVIQTEQKLKEDKVKGIAKASRIHLEEGQKVRTTLIKNSDTLPENFLPEQNIKQIRESDKLKEKPGNNRK